ncbi:MAG: hypothetical protein ACJAYU_005067 [Bradymonadia bacterium]|jgi:hypothetical protein
MNDLDLLLRATLADPEVPESVRGFLEHGAKLDDLRLDAFGRWSFNGSAVENARVARLFTRSLRQTAAGTWILEVGRYTYPVTVEGTATFIRRLEIEGPAWHGVTTTDERLPLVGAALVTDGDRFIGVEVAGAVARFVESAYQTVLSWTSEGSDGALFVDAPDGSRPLRRSESPTDGPPIS